MTGSLSHRGVQVSDSATCVIEGCSKPRKARGLCDMHYSRLWRAGQIQPKTPAASSAAAFMERVVKHPSGCWLFPHALNHEGYGHLAVKGRKVRAHRFAYELFVGPIPDGMVLDHVRDRGCRFRHCVNPEHLEPVTQRVNLLRAPRSQPAISAAKTHCPQGHPYDEENTTIVMSDGRPHRRCRACYLERNRQRYWRDGGELGRERARRYRRRRSGAA